jgi:hypothetical protein
MRFGRNYRVYDFKKKDKRRTHSDKTVASKKAQLVTGAFA